MTRTGGAGVARAAAALAGAALALAGCTTAGPDYRRPAAPVSEGWREASPADAQHGLWKPATPQDLAADDRWWRLYRDRTLDALAEAVLPGNQSVAAAEAQYRQAVALIAQARAGLLPAVTGDVLATRSQSSLASGARGGVVGGGASAPVTTVYDTGFNASWEIDLWGRIARSVEANTAAAQASAADLAAARLSARAALAQSYFQLRIAERRARLLADTVAAYRQALRIAENRYAAGVVPRSDVIQAQSQLAAAEAQLLDTQLPRAQLEHAIAVLTGRPPAALAIERGELPALPRDLPLALPSTLIERRPDIAAAERRMAAANAQVGVATAPYFPTLTLSGLGGFRSTDYSRWITAPARYWSLGPTLALAVFDGGRRSAVLAQNEALYDQRVAQWRQAVLAALQEVEDNLVALRVLHEEAGAQQRAVDLARRALEITVNQYRAGLVGFGNVVVAQTSLLNAELAALSVLGRQFDASVLLVRALGGGWSAQAPQDGPAP